MTPGNMNPKFVDLLTLGTAICALGLAIENRITLNSKVLAFVDEREKGYCEHLVKKMNESYFESMAKVMDQGVTHAVESKQAADGK
jgi:hypothetical protein